MVLRTVLYAALVIAAGSRLAFALPVPVQEHYQWYSDDGPEASATAKAPPDQPYKKLVAGERVRLRFCISNQGEAPPPNPYRLRLEYSNSLTNQFKQVPIATAREWFEMVSSPHVANGQPTTNRSIGTGVHVPGVCVEFPSNRTDQLTIDDDTYGNFVYCLRATTNAIGGNTYFFRVSDYGVALDHPDRNGRYDQIAEVLVVGRPVVTNGAAQGVGTQSASMHGKVVDARGDDPHVLIYWGDSDGGVIPGAWSNVVDLGVQPNSFSHTLSGLPANEVIYYRCCASNLAGTTWASATTNFTTLSPEVAFTNEPYVADETNASTTVTVVMDTLSAEEVTVVYETVDGTASSGSDYTAVTGILRWASGETGGRDIIIPLSDDPADEPGELFHVRLSNPTNCTIDMIETSVAIIDDDGLPTIQFTDADSTGHESVATVPIGLTLTPAAGQDVFVQYTVAGGGTAVAGQDYVFTSGVATIVEGRTESNIFLTVLEDVDYEMSETVKLTISAPSNALLGVVTSHVYTITDTDPRPATVDNWNGASGISSAGATLRGQVLDTGRNEPSVSIYWGPTDGGTTIGAWSNMVPFGVMGVGTFGSNVTAVTTGMLYYYRAYASNVAGAAWAAASENFEAVDPPTFLLLDNESLETYDNSSSTHARSWLRGGGESMTRVDEFPRSGSHSILFPSELGAYMYGYGKNAFQASWNGRYLDGELHPNGGIRPGFVLNGVMHVRAREVGMDSSDFTFGWRNLDDSSNWMSNQISCAGTLYQEVQVANTNAIPPTYAGDRFLPAVKRDSVGAKLSDTFHVDDVTVQVTVPRLWLERDPSVPIMFPPTVTGTSTEKQLGVKSQGGGQNTVLYGAYLPSSGRVTDKDWDFTAWHEIFDPSNAFEIVLGDKLIATNGAGYQYTTIAFAPTTPGTHTGVVRIATTDPNDYYPGGGKLYNSLVYEQYMVIGKAIRPPLVESTALGVREGNSGRKKVVFTLSLETQVLVNASFEYVTGGGDATAGEDYMFKAGTASIPAGERTFEVETEIIGDLEREPDEVFYLVLSDPSNATLPDPPYVACTIRDDESMLIILR